MKGPIPLDLTDKRTAAVVLAAVFGLGIAVGAAVLYGLSSAGDEGGDGIRAFPGQGVAGIAGSSGRRDRPYPIEVDEKPVIYFRDLMEILSPEAEHPVAGRFAREFRSDEGLEGALDEYERTDDMEGFVRRLRRSKKFGDMLERYGEDHDFRTIAKRVGDHPKLAPHVNALDRGVATSGLSMIRPSSIFAGYGGPRHYRPLEGGSPDSGTLSPGARTPDDAPRTRYRDPGHQAQRYEHTELAPIPDVVGVPLLGAGVGTGPSSRGSDEGPEGEETDIPGTDSGGGGSSTDEGQESGEGAPPARKEKTRRTRAVNRTRG
ncbi:hypothetical protein ACFL2T_03350 [Elusimicrobiota bacterium]